MPIYISEYEAEASDDAEQLAVMQGYFPILYTHPSVRGITYWGYIVGSTWRTGTGLIRQDGTPRPAMEWLMGYLGRDSLQRMFSR